MEKAAFGAKKHTRHGVVTYLYSFTYNLLLGSQWLQQLFTSTSC